MNKKNSRPLHKRGRSISSRLSSELRDDYGFRSLPVREGDKVRLIGGDFKGVEGEVSEVDTKSQRMVVEGVETAKADGTEVPISVHPSNVEITDFEEDDMREKIIERRSEGGQKRRKEASEEAERSEVVEDAQKEKEVDS
ncbi:hypothetical protein AKJ41_02915 [candidate division MSBL1 archaeon SCGC-AAA259O05]|uniref:Large ribosomal subunit protein uL24 n=1 Tax=candidate division MSBL1 archaeon SCGC-AAA259O05 TaxID=1698271 RepID=A0A133V3P2_9EURY|nr:hypothetical protein AKJ41_02915 [candidate division MSBL1 archaeon SCGC-AAA259O05]